MNWQDRARQLIATEEMTSCLNQLSNPRPGGPIKGISLPPPPPHPSDFFSGSETESQDSSHADASEQSLFLHPLQQQQLQPPALSNSEHAYSTGINASPVATKMKNVRKSPLIPRPMNAMSSVSTNSSIPLNLSTQTARSGPLLKLSPSTISRLEDLLLEGDSLEVSLDETAQFGRILQAAKPPPEPPVMALLYSSKANQEDDAMDCDSIKGGEGGKKRAVKKRRLNSSGEKPFKVWIAISLM